MLSTWYHRAAKHYDVVLSVVLIVSFAAIPLLVDLPYRINIFLSWEGAYRMYLGQMPFQDFTIPLGYAFWLIPTLFFHLFGPNLHTLVIAQVFINIVSGLAFWSILRTLSVRPAITVLSVLVFCLSYSFFNFWPWYNHTVIVYQIIGLALVLRYVFSVSSTRWLYLVGGGLFLFLSFFTKQDGGGLGFAICSVLLAYVSWAERSPKPLLIFLGAFVVTALGFIVPLLSHNFSYWFNYGQPPHFSRIAITDFLTDVLGSSRWEKFYLLLIGLILLHQVKSLRAFIDDKRAVVFLLLTLGILVEALLFQVTSYVPPDNNIFFHSFAFAYVMSHLKLTSDLRYGWRFAVVFGLVFLWWSGSYWRYVDRLIERVLPTSEVVETNENRISKSSWNIGQNDTTQVDIGPWTYSSLPVFRRVYMPEKTVEGIDRLLQLPVLQQKKQDVALLNMSELTPLAHAIGYELPTGVDQPLWYHLGVSAFPPQVDEYCRRIANREYDVVLFEYIPYLNNFYPFEVRDRLKEHYRLIDTFPAPRSDGYSPIEVYVR